MRERDPFGDFARMRREMDELFGDFWQRAGASRREGSFVPRVDVYYCGEPRKAIVEADLPGVDPGQVHLEIRGRALAISGERAVRQPEGRTYQQVELPTGRFRRVIELGAEVEAEQASATYTDGVLRIELPLRQRAASRQVPIDRGEE